MPPSLLPPFIWVRTVRFRALFAAASAVGLCRHSHARNAFFFLSAPRHPPPSQDEFRRSRMPAQPFSVYVDPDDLARHELAAAVPVPSLPESGRTGADAKHGAGADRMAARHQSERARSSRAAGAAGGRSYAFRRS
jgi:hypothetical protein